MPLTAEGWDQHTTAGGDLARRWARRLALFLVVVGARFWLIQQYASALPFWDQWDGIGVALIKPWLNGHLDGRVFFLPHNEHHIVLTRLLSLAVFAANGQWDNLVEAAVNAVFCGISAVCLAGMFGSVFGPSRQRIVTLAVGVYFVLPFGWENTLVGFQSQNYFLIFFSLLAIWGMELGSFGAARWWVGLMGLGLACLSMASGFLAAAVVFALGTMRLAAERRRPRVGEGVTLMICLGVVAAGWLTRVEVPQHAVLKAESLPAFAWALGWFMAWPADQMPGFALLAVLPTAVLAWRWLIAQRTADNNNKPHRMELLLTISGWALLQTAAMAYGRGGNAASPACRYMDLLAINPLVNFLIWLALADEARGTRWRRIVLVGAGLWTALLAFGLWMETAKDFNGWLPDYRAEMQRSEQNARGYVLTHDFARYLADKPLHDLPYPSAIRLASLLDDLALRAVLPAVVRVPLAPLSIEAKETPAAFAPGGLPPVVAAPAETAYWGSYTAGGAMAQGTLRASFASTANLPYLRFWFIGDLSADGQSFSLSDTAGARRTKWHSRRPAQNRWRLDDLCRPSREFIMEAADQSPTYWFAFSSPVEVGFWSHWTGFVLRRSSGIFVAGLLLGGLLELASWAVARRRIARLTSGQEVT